MHVMARNAGHQTIVETFAGSQQAVLVTVYINIIYIFGGAVYLKKICQFIAGFKTERWLRLLQSSTMT